MLDHAQPSFNRSARATGVRAHAALTAVKDLPGRECVNENKEKTAQQVWVNEMVRVRDARDKAAFAALFAHFAPRIKGYLIKSGADATTAEECAQDVMTTLWRKADQFDPARASVATWIFTIARNRRIDMLRRDRRPEPEDLPWGPEPEPEQSQVLELQQESARLAQAIEELPKNQRKLIEQGTIKSRLRLALDRLRHSMK